MRITKALLLFTSLFIFTNTVQAGILIEPYVGYSLGSSDRGNFEYDYKTPQLGARLGYSFLGLMGGVDYSLAPTFDLESENTTTQTSGTTEMKKNQLGLFVGYELPILLRAWATYYLSANMEGTSEYSGGGYGLGVGFTGLPFVSLNLEYRSISYDKVETSGRSAAMNPTLDFNEIILSISLPL